MSDDKLQRLADKICRVVVTSNMSPIQTLAILPVGPVRDLLEAHEKETRSAHDADGLQARVDRLEGIAQRLWSLLSSVQREGVGVSDQLAEAIKDELSELAAALCLLCASAAGQGRKGEA